MLIINNNKTNPALIGKVCKIMMQYFQLTASAFHNQTWVWATTDKWDPD